MYLDISETSFRFKVQNPLNLCLNTNIKPKPPSQKHCTVQELKNNAFCQEKIKLFAASFQISKCSFNLPKTKFEFFLTKVYLLKFSFCEPDKKGSNRNQRRANNRQISKIKHYECSNPNLTKIIPNLKIIPHNTSTTKSTKGNKILTSSYKRVQLQ